MAEINVERKGPSIWPWIIALLALALLIWGVSEWLGDDGIEPVAEDVPAVRTGPEQAEAGAPASAPMDPVASNMPALSQEFIRNCAQPADAAQEAGPQHQFTVRCLRDLTAALDNLVVRSGLRGDQLGTRLNDLRNATQQLQAASPTAATHAGTARDAFVAAAAYLESAQQAGYAGGPVATEVPQVRTAAEAVQPDAPLLEQNDAVHRFFREAADAVRVMAETPPTL